MNTTWMGLTFDADTSRVGSVTAAELPCSLQLMLPLLAARGRRVTWREAADRVGASTTGPATWTGVVPMLPSDWQARPPAGTVDSDTLLRCLNALAPGRFADEPVAAVFWDVYAERDSLEARLGHLEPVPRAAGRDRWHDGTHLATTTTTATIAQLSRESHLRFPVLVVPHTGEFAIASPGYADSLYISCDPDTAARLRAHGLDCLAVDRDQALPAQV